METAEKKLASLKSNFEKARISLETLRFVFRFFFVSEYLFSIVLLILLKFLYCFHCCRYQCVQCREEIASLKKTIAEDEEELSVFLKETKQSAEEMTVLEENVSKAKVNYCTESLKLLTYVWMT